MGKLLTVFQFLVQFAIACIIASYMVMFTYSKLFVHGKEKHPECGPWQHESLSSSQLFPEKKLLVHNTVHSLHLNISAASRQKSYNQF